MLHNPNAASGRGAIAKFHIKRDTTTWGDSYRSASQGKSWDAVARTGIVADTAIRSLTLIDKALFAGTTGAIYKSSDDGNTWTEVKAGLPETSTFFSMAGRGDTLFAGADTSGVFVTKDGGASWAPANAGLTDTHISQLVLFGSRLFAVTLNGVFVSDDSGTSWTAQRRHHRGRPPANRFTARMVR